ncbi:MAG TPA: hypothetical protein VNU71_18455 [Burkholderiaceae bacterium]|nr:hypothetical protein [Burkholderiaceae bacterium]
MSVVKSVSMGFEIDTTPEVQPDGRYVARAILTHLADASVKEIRPDFEAFATAAEASAAAHLAAIAWISHR